MNRHSRNWLLALGLMPAAVAAQSVPASGTSVTLFNSGRVLVRRTLATPLPSGTSTQTLALGEFNPGTFATLDPGVQLVSVKSDQDLSEETLLRRYVGHVFEIDTGRTNATARATLVSMTPERWEWTQRAGVVFGRPGRVVWPDDLVPTVQTADVSVQSDRARPAFRVMYETSGSAWSAAYRVYLGGAGRIEGVASIASGVLQLPDAEVQLASGNIGYAAPMQAKAYSGMAARDEVTTRQTVAAMQAPAPESEAIGEGHLYTLPSRVSFAAGTNIVVPLFEPVVAKAERRYTVSGALGFYGGLGQQPDEQPVPVTVAYRLARKLGTAFGDLPLPGGYVGIFEPDQGGRMQLVGQGYTGAVAPGDEMLVEAGTAFDVSARRVQTEYSTTPVTRRTVATIGYRVTLRNAKDSAVVVDVREDRGGDWSVIESSLVPDRKSSTRVVFSVPVPARDSAVLTYRVRVVW